MTDKVETIGFRDLSVEASDSNRVLRNTYWLLTLTLLPTVLGAWFGIASGVSYYLSGGLGLVFFLAGTFGFVYAIEKNKDSSLGIVFLLGFTFFMGLMLSRLIAMVLASLATVIKRDLSSMGKWLFVGVIVLMVASIINIFVGSSAGMLAISVLSIGIFSAFMLYDIKRIIDGGETNYISATLALYMNAINIFQSLLILLGIMGGDKE